MTHTSKKKWGVDTNILIYLVDDQHLLHQAAVALVQFVETHNITLVLTHQNMLEFTNVFTKYYKFNQAKVTLLQKHLITSFDPHIVQPNPFSMQKYLELCQSTDSLQNHFDLYFASTLLANQVLTLVTNNPKDFNEIPGLRVVPLTKLSLH